LGETYSKGIFEGGPYSRVYEKRPFLIISGKKGDLNLGAQLGPPFWEGKVHPAWVCKAPRGSHQGGAPSGGESPLLKKKEVSVCDIHANKEINPLLK